MKRHTFEDISDILDFIHSIDEEKSIMLTQMKLADQMNRKPEGEEMDFAHCVFAVMSGHRKAKDPEKMGPLFFTLVAKVSMIGVEGGFGFALMPTPEDDAEVSKKEWEERTEEILGKMKGDPKLKSVYEFSFENEKWQNHSKST